MSHQIPALIQSLQNPILFAHKVEYFKLIETHISWVLLTGRYAYKIKKPVNLGFLDFSSLDKRWHFCHEELRLNGRLAKDIYLDVVAITGTKETPEINGSGVAIEYAVKMRQFDPAKTFDQLLKNNQLTRQYIRQTAKIISAFHGNIDKAADDTEFGRAASVMLPVQENFKQILQLNSIEKPDVLDYLLDWTEQQQCALQPVFNQRKRDGFIRLCHGDLHLANIALIDQQIVPFDGIEFNPSLYWIDVISDIAFLVMDLQHKQRPDLAFQFVNDYLQQTGDYGGLKLLPFYLHYRAMVRAKVSAITATQKPDSKEGRLALADYHGYLKLAFQYTQSTSPFMIIMQGVSGSGKSWLSEQIIEYFPAIRIRSDIERKRLYSSSTEQKNDVDINNGLYSRQTSLQTYQRLQQLATEIINAGYSVIVDATFLQRQMRQQFFQLAEQLVIPFRIVHTHTDKQTLLNRVKNRAGQEGNVSDADQQVLQQQLSNSEALTRDELDYTIEIETTGEADLSPLWKKLKSLPDSP